MDPHIYGTLTHLIYNKWAIVSGRKAQNGSSSTCHTLYSSFIGRIVKWNAYKIKTFYTQFLKITLLLSNPVLDTHIYTSLQNYKE